jgi:hypothetical protein
LFGITADRRFELPNTYHRTMSEAARRLELVHRRAAGRDRKRRERSRAAAGRIRLAVELDEAALTAGLLEAGLITPADQDDPRKLAAALERLIEAILTADLSRVTAPKL